MNAFGTTDSCLDSDCLSCEKKLGYVLSYNGSYGSLANETWVYFENFKILYRLNYLGLCFVNISVMSLIVLELHIVHKQIM